MIASQFPVVPFSRAVRDTTGGNFKVQGKDYQSIGEIPVVDQGQDFTSGFTNSSHAYQGELPVVLFGDHTKALKYVNFSFALGADGVKVLTPAIGFEAKFLYFYFRSLRLPDAGYSRHFKFLKEVVVPKPTVEQQLRIVDLMSRAEGIVRLRREAQKKAAELIPAIFLEMFGDPRTNPKGWPVHELGALLAAPPTLGTMAKPSTTEADWLDLRVANIQDGQLTLEDRKWLDLPPEQVERFSLKAGDIVLARAIGSLDHLGKAVVVQPTSNWTFDSHLMRIRLDAKRILPDWLVAFLSSAGAGLNF